MIHVGAYQTSQNEFNFAALNADFDLLFTEEVTVVEREDVTAPQHRHWVADEKAPRGSLGAMCHRVLRARGHDKATALIAVPCVGEPYMLCDVAADSPAASVLLRISMASDLPLLLYPLPNGRVLLSHFNEHRTTVRQRSGVGLIEYLHAPLVAALASVIVGGQPTPRQCAATAAFVSGHNALFLYLIGLGRPFSLMDVIYVVEHRQEANVVVAGERPDFGYPAPFTYVLRATEDTNFDVATLRRGWKAAERLASRYPEVYENDQVKLALLGGVRSVALALECAEPTGSFPGGICFDPRDDRLVRLLQSV